LTGIWGRVIGQRDGKFREVDRAGKLLGLGEVASLKQIKAGYRKLAHSYHLDLDEADEGRKEAMRELNRAYELLEDYCSNYKCSFGEEDVARAYPDEAYLERWRKKWSM
jgi:preprotein translocase subunit Sec63